MGWRRTVIRVIWHRGTARFVGLCLALGVSTQWFTINLSPSVPYGLYRKGGTGTLLAYGDLVLVPAVPYGRGWWAHWWPLLKPIAGMPGDEVCVHAEGLWVNQQPYGAVHQTWRGQPLPVFWGCHTVGEGEVFVASRVPQSLDGRYLGMTRVAETRLAIPVWTWR